MSKPRPYLISSEDTKGTELHPLPPQERIFQEEWLQELLYNHPSILPVENLDEAFAPAIPIGREIANIDNLFISPSGLLTIVETKLWRNPEAHRTVVAQILDYASTLAKWDFQKLDAAVQSFMERRHGQHKSIYNAVRARVNNLEYDEIEFQQRVQDCLANGRFALLIVGDRIYPEATQLGEVIQSAPHLQFTLGFAELRCFRLNKDSNWPLVIFPEFVSKTHEITRAVVKVIYEEHRPEVEVDTFKEEETSPGRTTLPVFVASLPSAIAEDFRSHIERWMKTGYTIYWGQSGLSLRLYWNGRLRTICDAYPDSIGILMDKYVEEWDLPRESYYRYKDVLMASALIGSVFASGKKYVYYDNLSGDEIRLLLDSIDRLAQDIYQTGNSKS